MTLFSFSLSEKDVIIFNSKRKEVARELQDLHALQKLFSSKKDFENARFVSTELIKPLERLSKAFNIAKNILISGSGKINPYPEELMPELLYVKSEILYS